MGWKGRHTSLALIAALLFLSTITTALTAQSTEIVRGKVIDGDHKPIEGADVVITGQTNGFVQRMMTDARGQYSAIFTDAEGSYRVVIRKIGYTQVIVSVRQTGLAIMIAVSDVTLTATTAVPLKDLVSTTPRLAPSRAERPSIGGTEQNAMNAALFSLDPSDLNGLMASLPGVMSLGDSGFSVLGVPGTQNSTLVDGMTFGGGALPRDAVSTQKLVTMTFDPSKGQFAGAQTVMTTKRGTTYGVATLRAQLADPHLAWADPQSPSPVPQIGSASGYASGPLFGRSIHFLLAIDVSNRATATPSLLSPRPSLLSQLGLSADTVAAITRALTTLGAPLFGPSGTAAPATLRGSASLRLDYSKTATKALTLSAIGNWSDASGTGVSELAFPSSSGRRTSGFARVMLNGSAYIGGVLEEFRTSASSSESFSEPYLGLPGGVVSVGTEYTDGRTSLTLLRFGGSAAGESRMSSHSWDTENESSWLIHDGQHQVKVSQEVRLDWNNTLSAANQYGSFAYQTLADLAANRPASFTRTLFSAGHTTQDVVASFSIGDTWRAVRNKLDFQAGVRFDVTNFSTVPQYNGAVDSLFGVRTDHAPFDAGFSPRLGFSWSPGAKQSGGLPPGMVTIAPNGAMLSRGTGVDPTGLSIQPIGSAIVVTGGIGALRGTISPLRVGTLIDATGLSGTSRFLSCVGDATPVPQWNGPGAATPTTCLDGGGSQAFSVNQPAVSVFDPTFHVPVSWRGSLQVSGLRVHSWAVAPKLLYSLGVNGESRVDLNLSRQVEFNLAGEGNRPVFAPAMDIVPGTGLFAPGAARLSTAYSSVSNTISDLHSNAVQLNISVVPPKPLFGTIPMGLTYSYNVQRSEQRGFGGTTAGDPYAKEWVSGQQATHQFQVTATNIRLWWFTLAAQVNVLSGLPYTPVVAQDVNGDGLANDRAFVANPTTTRDTTLASQMNALLGATPSGARNCLIAQFGQIARTNSCRTPWQARLDLNIGFTPPQPIGAGNRLRVTATMLNVSGALVRLFGLQNTPLGQSPQSTAVDPRLLYVTGFDPVNQRFKYRVNQLFGEPLDFGTTRNRFPPFQLQLGIEYQLGGPPKPSAVREFGLLPLASDSALTIPQALLKLRNTATDPLLVILRRRDSLRLTLQQTDSIVAIDRELNARVDSLFAPLAAYIAGRGKALTDSDFLPQLNPIRDSVNAMIAAERAKVLALLTPEQRRQLAPRSRP